MKTIAVFLFFSLICAGLYAQEVVVYKGDTVNQKDAAGLKQGLWVSYYGPDKPESEITFVNDKPNGPCRFYYPSGKVREEGNWVIDKWVGPYTFYHPNGQPYYIWKYDESGKRTGEQKYFHNNGQVMIQGTWQNGQETGTVKEYDRNGNLIAAKTYNQGKLDKSSVQKYQPQNNTDAGNDANANNEQDDGGTKPVHKPSTFDGNGYHEFLNENGKPIMAGQFKDGKLMEGKRYYYDESGKASYIDLYSNGSVLKTIKAPKEEE